MIGTNATHAAIAFLFSNPGFDHQADFEPIDMVGILPLVYVAAVSSLVNNIQDLVKASKAKPNGLNTAVSTSTCRLAPELFTQRAEAPMVPVDFKGSAQAVTAQIGGHIEFMVDTITSLRTQVISGQVKAFGVTSATASKLLLMVNDPVVKTGDELKTFVAAEKEKWGRLINSAGLKPS